MRDPRSPRDAAAARSLLLRWQKEGDEEALDQLLQLEVSELAARLRSRTSGQLGASTSASDLAQEAVFRMLRQEQPPAFETPEELRSYLWKSAWRLFLDRMKAPARRVRRLSEVNSSDLAPAVSDSTQPAEIADRDRALELTLNLLREEDREVLVRCYFQQQSIASLAVEWSMSRAAVEMRLTRARRRLAQKLARWAEIVG